MKPGSYVLKSIAAQLITKMVKRLIHIYNQEGKQITSIQIVDVIGKVIATKDINSNEGSIDASNLSNGVYFAKIASDNTIETVKLVKN